LITSRNKNIENNPATKVKIKGKIKLGEKVTVSILRTLAPRIAGIANRKENLIAFSFFTPKSIAVEVVEPDLEIPGITAMAWANPTINELLRFKEPLGFVSEAANKNVPVVINPRAIMKRFENVASIVDSIKARGIRKREAIIR